MEENKIVSDVSEEECGEPQDAPTEELTEESTEPESDADSADSAEPVEAETPKEKERKGISAAYVYAIVMTALFTLSFAALSFILLLGYRNGYFVFGDGKYLEKVIYVREYDSESGYLTLPEIYDKVSPSVVSVESRLAGGTSIGTGFVMDSEGHIATNYHVVENASSVNIIFINGITVKAEIVGKDALADLAVLKIEQRSDLVPVEFGNSDALVVGEDVCAIGNPANIEYAGSLTQGIVSGINRNVKTYDESGMLVKTTTYIQTDTTLNPGNSGGPLIDMYGKVIGVNTLKLVGKYEGISFALPINGALDILRGIIEGKESSGGSIAAEGVKLGITCGSVVEGGRYTIDGTTVKIAGATGVIVSKAAEEGYSSHGILLLEDIIISVDGVVVTTADELRTELYKHKVGESAVFSVYRNGEIINLTIVF